MSAKKTKYYNYTLKEKARALYISATEATRPPSVPTAPTKYSVTLGLSKTDADALFALEKQAITEAFGSWTNADDYQLCVVSGNKAADRAIAAAALAARSEADPEKAFKIKERAEERAKMFREYAGILTASSRIAFHDRFLDRYMNELSAEERSRADSMGFKLSVLENGKLVVLDDAHRFATYKDKFYRGAFVGGAFTLSPWGRKTVEAKDGVSAYIAQNGLVFIEDGERMTGSGPTIQDSFAHFTGQATDYSPSQAAISEDEF
ncbi:hypothetical protein RZS08_08285 [Arthrospira platensis SPKY1]|nr:hypothetical protein [Arthrospira platensis SPKY1]